MEHNTDRILWTVLILAIGISLFAIFKPAANNLLNQVTEKIQTVANNVNSNPSDSSNSSSSSSNTTDVKPSILTATTGGLMTAPASSDKLSGGILGTCDKNIFKVFGSDIFTINVFIHNTTNHTVNAVMWTDKGGYGVGTGVPAHTDGVSTVKSYLMDPNSTTGYLAIRAYADNAAISGVQYKMEQGNIDNW